MITLTDKGGKKHKNIQQKQQNENWKLKGEEKMKKVFALLLALVMLCAFAACSQEGENNTPADSSPSESAESSSSEAPTESSSAEGKVIGFSNTMSDEYSMLVYQIVEECANEQGIEVVHISCDGSGEKQLSDIEDLITQGVDLIYIRAWDPDAIVPAIEACEEAGIPTVIADYPVNTDKGSLYFTVDQTGYGVAQANYVISLLEDNPDLVINLCYLWGSFNFPPAQSRRDGVIDTLQPYIEEGRVNFLDEQSIEGDMSEVMSKTEDWITRFQDANCFIGANDDIADGMANTLKANGYTINEDAWVLGIDGTEVGLADVQNGVISGTVSYDLQARTEQMMEYVFELLDGKSFGETEEEKTIVLEANETLVTVDNVADFLE